jgi:small subunit ribosomal protein S3
LGQKTHPTGFRVGIIKPWVSTWYAKVKDYAQFVAEDAKIRKFIKKKLYTAGVSRILIARKAQQNTTITVVTAKPGIVVGRGGQGIEDLRKEVSKFIKRPVVINVVEVARIDLDGQLVAESIALQLEKRVAFRRAMKQAMQRTMRAGAQGIKVMVSGRLGGAEIARSEWAKEGRIPLQTLRADVDYGETEADTIMGKIGVKVWVFKGNLMPGEKADANIKAKSSKNQGEERAPRRSRRSKAVETENGTVEVEATTEE